MSKPMSTTRFVLAALGIVLAGLIVNALLIIGLGALPIWHT